MCGRWCLGTRTSPELLRFSGFRECPDRGDLAVGGHRPYGVWLPFLTGHEITAGRWAVGDAPYRHLMLATNRSSAHGRPPRARSAPRAAIRLPTNSPLLQAFFSSWVHAPAQESLHRRTAAHLTSALAATDASARAGPQRLPLRRLPHSSRI